VGDNPRQGLFEDFNDLRRCFLERDIIPEHVPRGDAVICRKFLSLGKHSKSQKEFSCLHIPEAQDSPHLVVFSLNGHVNQGPHQRRGQKFTQNISFLPEIIRDPETPSRDIDPEFGIFHMKPCPFLNFPAVMIKIVKRTKSHVFENFQGIVTLENREEAPLAMKGHTIHFDLAQEQGRIIDRTYYIADPEDQVSSLANRMDRPTALGQVKSNMTDIMKGMTMIIGFYMRGPVGSPVSNPALEITSSAYVAHSAELLYRNAFTDFDNEVKARGHFFTNLHSQGLNRPEDLPHARVFMDRKFRTTFSWKCTYAGNTLLLKKGNHRFAVDKAVYENFGNELSEHMFITGIKGPGGRITWFAGAAPSGCGKTTTAMAGNVFIGDDLAQMWIADDGSIRSVNPECGIFGIVENVNSEGDPLLMKILRKPGYEVIWSNVLIDENKAPHWVGNNEEHPDKGFNFQGEWHKGKKDNEGKPVPMSHPNSRCTLRSSCLENYSSEAENPEGALTRVFTYSGRDADTMPPVWVAKNT